MTGSGAGSSGKGGDPPADKGDDAARRGSESDSSWADRAGESVLDSEKETASGPPTGETETSGETIGGSPTSADRPTAEDHEAQPTDDDEDAAQSTDDDEDAAQSTAEAVAEAPGGEADQDTQAASEGAAATAEESQEKDRAEEQAEPPGRTSRPAEEPEGGPDEKRPAMPIARYTVLLVTQDEPTLAAVQEAMPDGYELITARDDTQGFDLARKLAPDAILVDPAAGGATLARRLGADPLTSNTPFIQLLESSGDDTDEDQGPERGTAAWLKKPLEPEEVRARLRSAVEGLSTAPPLLRSALGELTVAELVELVEKEIEQWVLESGGPQTPETSVKLGEISELVGALWDFIAQLRQAVTRGSDGRVVFGPLDEGRLGILRLTKGLAEPEPVQDVDIISEVPAEQIVDSIAGLRAVVADDEPDVRELLSAVLGEAGLEVEAVANGVEALEAIWRNRPDVVVTDILMPEMDGWELLRRLRRDLILRDLPVVVLSSKGDFLRSLRRRHDGAKGGEGSNVDHLHILLGIAQVLSPHRQIIQRIEKFEKISGRVESTGIVPLLLAVAAFGGNRRLVVRETGNVYHADFRDGSLVAVGHTSSTGRQTSGLDALRLLLGISAGRYGMSPLTEEISTNLEGELDDVLRAAAEPIHRQVEMVAGEAMLRIRRVVFHDDVLADYARGASADVRQVLDELRRERTPKDLLLNRVSRTPDLERILLDLVRRGAVERVVADRPSVPPPMQPRASQPEATSPAAPPGLGPPNPGPAHEGWWVTLASRPRVILYLALVGAVAFVLARWGAQREGEPVDDGTTGTGLLRAGGEDPTVRGLGTDGGVLLVADLDGGHGDGALGEDGWGEAEAGVARVPEVRIVVETPENVQTGDSWNGDAGGDALAGLDAQALAETGPQGAQGSALATAGDGGPSPEEDQPVTGARYGTLEITQPRGTNAEVNVIVDGQPRGRAPLALSLLPGVHQIVYEAGGQRSYAAVRIVAGRTIARTPRIPSIP